MGLHLGRRLKKIGKWLGRHPEVTAVIPALGVIERVAEEVLKVRASFDDKHLRGLAVEVLRRRLAREPGADEIKKLLAELQKRGVG